MKRLSPTAAWIINTIPASALLQAQGAQVCASDVQLQVPGYKAHLPALSHGLPRKRETV
jgi:hypothetical protein